MTTSSIPIPTADYYSLHGIFASTVEPGGGEGKKYGNGMNADAMAAANAYTATVAARLTRANADSPQYADYLKQKSEIEKRNLDEYYKLVQQKGDDFRKNATGYTLIGVYSRKAERDDLLTRNKLIVEYKLDKEIFQQLRFRPKDYAIFAPMVKFAELPADQYPAKAREILDEIKTGHMGGQTKAGKVAINPLVIEAFKNVTPDSVRNVGDVAGIYGKLFADIGPKAAEYIRASHGQVAGEVKGFDPNLVELIQYPAPAHPASELATTEQLRAVIQEIPQQNGGAYRNFEFSALNELDLTHPGAPALPMLVTDAPNPHNSPVFIRGEALNRGTDRAAPIP